MAKSDIDATKAELCDDLRRTTEYCLETSRFALEWLRRAEAAEREHDALKAEVERLKAALTLAANRLDRLALENMPLQADADDWARSARAALNHEGEQG